MTQDTENVSDDATIRARQFLRTVALSRWENEGGAFSAIPSVPEPVHTEHSLETPLAASEVAQLKVRLIALENVIVAMLAESPPRHFELIREMAAFITPRSGFTPHPLTVHAASEMLNLANRADRFRGFPEQ